MGEVVTSRAFFFPLASWMHENHGLTLNAPNDVFPCRLVTYGVIFPPRGNFPRCFPKNQNFGGVNRHFKPNLKTIQITISSKLCDGLTRNLTGWCDLPQRLRGWSYMNGRHLEFWKVTISQPPIEILAPNFVWWLSSKVESRLYVKNSDRK